MTTEYERDLAEGYARGVEAERARVIALIEAEIDRWTDLSGQGTDGDLREKFGRMADAVADVLRKVQA
jgi:hypothetical protein